MLFRHIRSIKVVVIRLALNLVSGWLVVLHITYLYMLCVVVVTLLIIIDLVGDCFFGSPCTV